MDYVTTCNNAVGGTGVIIFMFSNLPALTMVRLNHQKHNNNTSSVTGSIYRENIYILCCLKRDIIFSQKVKKKNPSSFHKNTD